MCCVGEFNLSHSSLTSAAALTALRDLPQTNPALYLEITGVAGVAAGANTMAGDEADFGDDDDLAEIYGSDIPVDAVIAHVLSAGDIPAGFEAGENGSIVRGGMSEMTELEVEKEEVEVKVLGRGRREKTGSTRYGAEWEQH